MILKKVNIAQSEFEATKERFDEINEALPDFVEWSEKQPEVTIPDVPSY